MGKYLKLFETDSERVGYEDSESYLEPYVSYVEGDNSVHYNKPPFFCKLTLSNGDIVEIEGSGELTYNAVARIYSETLVSAEIGKLCTSIGGSAFSNCHNLSNITIPNTVTSIGSYAFSSCSGLTSVIIPNSVTSIGERAFSSCSGLTSVTIGNSVTSIDNYAFSYCTGLTSVIIPNTVTSIGGWAFQYCTSITSVTIGSGVTSIRRNAFNSCSSLSSVTIEATTPPTLYSYAFDNNASGRKIYVPNTSVDAYKAAANWSTYAADIEPIPTT